jgi:UDP-N-acetylmuramoyl-tripeptide--D-alanyl-D-alanine ligase
MRRSIEAARLMAGEAPLVLVLGDMKELGACAAKAHQDLGAVIKAVKPVAVFYQGEFAADVARSAEGVAVTPVTEPTQVLAALAKMPAPVDGVRGTLLVKGSRSCHMEAYSKALLEGLSATASTNGGQS